MKKFTYEIFLLLGAIVIFGGLIWVNREPKKPAIPNINLPEIKDPYITPKEELINEEGKG